MLSLNREFYDPLWAESRLVRPERFNTWPLVEKLMTSTAQRLEIGPGLRPRLPLGGTWFVDMSMAAVSRLSEQGGNAVVGLVSALPFPDASFDLVCALDIIEHVDGDEQALAELARVARTGATFLVAVPLHESQWTPFDDLVGHRRRYDPQEFLSRLEAHGFTVEHSACYGMQPKSSRLLDLGMWCLRHFRTEAMWWYNHVFMPIGLRFQKRLELAPGMIDLSSADQVLLICRKTRA